MTGFFSANAKLLKWFWTVLSIVLLTTLAVVTLNTPKHGGDPLTAEERSWLKNHPVIRFAPDPDFPPTEYFDSSGRYSGITADYLALLEKKLDIQFKIIRLQNWDAVIRQAKEQTGRHLYCRSHPPTLTLYPVHQPISGIAGRDHCP